MRMTMLPAVMVLMIVPGMGMTILLLPPPPAAASPSGTSTAASGLFLANQDNLKGNLLERQLVAGATEEFHGTTRRFLRRTQLDPDWLLREVRKGIPHLAIKNKGDIGIEFFLKLEELHLSVRPRSGFKHRQHEDVLAGVMGKCIKHARPLDAGIGRRAVLTG